MKHLVTYDLKTPGQNYRALIAAIQFFDHIRINGSCWAVKTNQTAIQLCNTLAPFLDASDDLIICDFHSWAGCHLPAEVMIWMNQ